MELAPGTRIDRYVVERRLGRGGMASVYQVRHEVLHARFALKVLDVASRGIERRMMEEGRIQAGLRHPNIVSVIDVVDVGGHPGLVMELVEGPVLDELVAKGTRWDRGELDVLVRGFLSGLAAAHGAGWVHRDLKPANLLLAATPAGLIAKISDFGLAKLLAPEGSGGVGSTRTGQVMGTPLYMAPEQFKDAKGVDARADVWSAGVLTYELVTGRRPYDGGDLIDIFDAIRRGGWPTPRQLDPSVPVAWDRAITAALQTDRERRPPDGAALLAAWCAEVPARASIAPSGPRPSLLSSGGQTLTASLSDELPAPSMVRPPTVAPPAPPVRAAPASPVPVALGVGVAGMALVVLLVVGAWAGDRVASWLVGAPPAPASVYPEIVPVPRPPAATFADPEPVAPGPAAPAPAAPVAAQPVAPASGEAEAPAPVPPRPSAALDELGKAADEQFRDITRKLQEQ